MSANPPKPRVWGLAETGIQPGMSWSHFSIQAGAPFLNLFFLEVNYTLSVVPLL